MTQPPGNSRNIHPTLQAAGGKEMAQIVVGKVGQPTLGACPLNGRVAADGVEHPRALFRNAAEKLLQGRKDRNGAGLASLGAGFRITPDNHGSCGKIDVPPEDVGCFAEPTSAVGEEFDKVGRVLTPATAGVTHLGDQLLEFLAGGQIEFTGFDPAGLELFGGVVPAETHANRRLENATEGAEAAVETGGRHAGEQEFVPPGLAIDEGDFLGLGLGEARPGFENVAEGLDSVALAAGLKVGVGRDELLVALDDLAHWSGGRGIGLGIEDFGLEFAVEEAGGGFRLGGETAGYKFIFMAHHRVENAGAGISAEIHDSVDLHELAHGWEYKSPVSKCQVLLV